MSVLFVLRTVRMTDAPDVSGKEVVIPVGGAANLPILLPFMMKRVDDQHIGWDEELIVTKPPFYEDRAAMYICGVCKGLPRAPIMLKQEKNCSHVVCATCAMTLVSVAKMTATTNGESVIKHPALCPMCRARFVASEVKDYDQWFPQMKIQWQMFRIRCSGRNCSFVGSPDELKKHEFDCPYQVYECPCKGCNQTGTRTELMTHVKTCKLLRMYCKTCYVSYYPNGEGQLGIHNCLEDLKLVATMMKNTLRQHGITWPAVRTCGFEPVCFGDADFDSEYGTAAMLMRKTLKRQNGEMMDDANALLTSSPRTIRPRIGDAEDTQELFAELSSVLRRDEVDDSPLSPLSP